MKSSRRKHLDDDPSIRASLNSKRVSFEEPLECATLDEGSGGGSATFDDLLKVLSSSNKNIATLYKKRKREVGKSDTKEDEEGTSESPSSDEGVDADSDSEYESVNEEEIELAEDANTEATGLDDEDEDRDGDEASDSGDSYDLEDKNSHIEAGVQNASPFHCHLERILTSEEVEIILKRKWKFTWEMPDVDIPTCKWSGTGEPLPKVSDFDMALGLQKKLSNHWFNVYKSSGSNEFGSSRQRFFFSLCSSYRDVMHCNKRPFYLKGKKEDSNFMDAYIMHALNHIYMTRALVMKNDAKLRKNQDGEKDEILCGSTFLDHGFTRPKVMIVLPLASIALRLVKRLIQLTPLSDKSNVVHMNRFSEEFGAVDGEDEEMLKANFKNKIATKPADFQTLFGGNNNDDFMIGIKITKQNIKLYSNFYSSDIIIASPLGLSNKIGELEFEKEKDVDYLSSIEVLIIDHADVIALQNWTHLNTIVEHLNRVPTKQHGTDVMRIRPWYLDGRAHFYRQTILLSSFVNPEMNGLFNRLCMNYEGKIKSIVEYKGVLPKILLQVRQVYEQFDAPSIVDADNARLGYFCKKVFPKMKDSVEGGTMLFISSYFEFVRVRNFLKSENASFCLLGDYTKQADISRARNWFYDGRRKTMLYTERAHFYHRYKINVIIGKLVFLFMHIRGVQNLIIYSLPERKDFYVEIINMLHDSKNMMCNILFSQFDRLKLERIVGTGAAKRMLSSDKSMFVFC